MHMKTLFYIFIVLFAFFSSAQETNVLTPPPPSKEPVAEEPQMPEKPYTDAEFPGGASALEMYIAKKLRYPRKVKKQKVEGSVMVQFAVEADGTITNIKVTKSLNKCLDEEAVRLVSKMPKWNPSIMFDEKVRALVNLPINFTLK